LYNVNFVIADALVDGHKIQQTYAAAAAGMVVVTRHSRRSGGRGKKYIFKRQLVPLDSRILFSPSQSEQQGVDASCTYQEHRPLKNTCISGRMRRVQS
jgi:hypothetical protein